MSTSRIAPKMHSGDGFLLRNAKMLLDVINLKGYSTLQKWLILCFVAIGLSWLSSVWLLIICFLATSAAGVKLTEQILHHERASHVAEQLFYKLESAYIEVRTQARQLKTIFSGKQNFSDSTISSTQIVNDLSSAYDFEGDRPMDGSAPLKISTDLRLELNSIQLLIIRDFVRSWYADFSYDSQFLKESKFFLQDTFNSITLHLSHQDPKLVLTKIIQLYHVHFTMYQKARNSFESHKIHPKTKVPQDSRFKRHSSVDDAFGNLDNGNGFHFALKSEISEIKYLRGIVSIILLSVCQAHMVEGACVRILLVQILTNKVMLPLMKMMSNPDWLMEMIIRLTSDEEIVGMDVDAANVEGSMVSSDENKEVHMNSDIAGTSRILGDQDKDSLLDYHECFDNGNTLENTILQNDQLTSDSRLEEEAESTLCEDSKQQLSVSHHDKHISMNHQTSAHSSLHEPSVSAKSSKQFSPQPQEHSTSDKAVEGEITKTVVESSIDLSVHGASADDFIAKGTCSSDITSAENPPLKKVPSDKSEPSVLREYKSVHPSSQPVPGKEEKELIDSEIDRDDYLDDPSMFENNPQKIISYGKRLSWGSTESDLSGSFAGSSVDETSSSLITESDTNSETMSKSFPSLSSFKSFITDPFKPSGKQQGLSKPTSLALLPGKIASNLNPLAFKRSLKSTSKTNGDLSQQPPQLMVDGVPVEKSPEGTSSPTTSMATSHHEHPTPVYSDTDLTPSPGFFSSVNSFFSRSSSHHEIGEIIEESPIPTPSPTSHSEFSIGGIAVLKTSADDQTTLRPVISDDGRIFQDVSIPSTEVSTEYRSTTQYSLYIIEYEALYFTEEGKSVIRSGVVKRRYREFTNLQSRLEDHQAYKKYLKKIRGPKRWPTLPFKSIDKDTVETRRLFLERYLKDLIEIEAICNGPDLREFLAYEGDSHIAFVKKSPDITVPRFDKMLMRGVSEVVDRIKALPNIPQEVMSGFRGRETPEEKQGRNRSQFDADMIEVNTAFSVDEISETSSILHINSLQVIADCEDEKELFQDMMTDHKEEQINEACKQTVEKILASLPRIEGDGAEAPETGAKKHRDIGLSLAVLDLLVQGLRGRDHWLCRDRVVLSMQSVLGKALNRYLESAISSLTTEPELTRYLRLLRETIWPQGQLWSESSPPRTDDQRAAIREQAKRCLINFFPETVRLAVGRKAFEEMITDFLSSIESEQLNRHLLYQILDHLMEQLFPKVTDHDLLHNLLFSRSRDGQPL